MSTTQLENKEAKKQKVKQVPLTSTDIFSMCTSAWLLFVHEKLEVKTSLKQFSQSY